MTTASPWGGLVEHLAVTERTTCLYCHDVIIRLRPKDPDRCSTVWWHVRSGEVECTEQSEPTKKAMP